jgi:hypothetical protein
MMIKKSWGAVLVGLLLLSVWSKTRKIPAPIGSEKRFTALSFEKSFEKTIRYCRWWIPIPEGYLAQQVDEKDEQEYNIIIFDEAGNEIRRGVVKHGQGPTDMLLVTPETVRLSADGRKVTFIDNHDFYKELDLSSLTVDAKFRLTNRIPKYEAKYKLGWSRFETKNGRTITSLESTGYMVDRTYFLAIHDEDFENFRIITSLKKGVPDWLIGDDHSGVVKVDYYNRLRWMQSFTVDWARETIYAIPDIERPEIDRIRFSGETDRLVLDVSGPLNICEEEFERFFQWHTEGTPQIVKTQLKFDYLKPVQAPPLMGLKVIGDWLLIITGNRDGNRKCNETLAYHLPSLEFEGTLWLPFPAAPELNLRWGEGYYYLYGEADDEERRSVQFYRYKKS